MKNRTVVIVQKGEGEYDSYCEQVTDVYIVPRKAFGVEMAYNKYAYRVIKENFPETGIEWRVWKNAQGNTYNEGTFYPKQPTSKQAKAIGNLLKIHDIHTFLKNECKAKQVEYFQTFLT